MAQLFSVVLSLSLSGALVGLLILLFRPLTGRFFAKRWTYYLWLLVIARLFLPFHADINLMEYLSAELTAAVAGQTDADGAAGESVHEGTTSDVLQSEQRSADSKAEKSAGTGTGNTEAVQQASNGETAGTGADNTETVQQASSGEMVGTVGSGIDDITASVRWAQIFRIVSMLWVCGVLFAVLRKFYAYRRFAKEVYAASRPVIDVGVLHKSVEIQMRLEIGKRVPLYESTAINSPMLIGFWQPRIYLPQAMLAEMTRRENDICLILHHELVHYKRKDILYKWLFQAALCVHWFNPFAYVFSRRFNVDCELACDETVLKLLSEEGRRAYGNVLLDVAQKHWSKDVLSGKGGRMYGNVPAMTLLEEKSTLKERLRGIARYHRTGIAVGLCSAAVLILFFAVSVVCGAADNGRGFGETFAEGYKKSFMGLTEHLWEKSAWSQMWGDSFDLAQPISVKSSGKAYRMYDDDALIAEGSESDCWRAWSYMGGDSSVNVNKFMLNGSDTLWILYTNKETTMEVSSAFSLYDGRFKIVCVRPDQTVQTLNESGEENTVKVTLPQGRNVIKMVGQKAKLEELEITYGAVKKRDIESIYTEEDAEYAYQVLNGSQPLDLSRLKDALPHLQAEEVSRLFRIAWQREIALSEEDWEDLWIYSDESLTSKYLLEELQAGRIREFDSRVLRVIAPHMKAETVSECFGCLLERGGMSRSDWEDIFAYSDSKKSAQYLAKALRRGDADNFSDQVLDQIDYQVSTKSLTDIVTALDKDQLSFEGLIEHVLPFVQKQDEAVTCVCHYIDLGNVLSDEELREIEGYFGEQDFYRVVEYNGKRKY